MPEVMKSILSINKLAFEIGVARDVLEDIANNKSKHYKPFTKAEVKHDGTIKNRKIDNPSKSIRQIQKLLNRKLLQPICNDLPHYSTGSIKERSIIDNALPHVHSSAILALDITNCFPSIDSSRIYGVFKTKLNCSPPVASLLTKLTTYGDRLPQGSPTSPSLCNLVLAPLCLSLNELATKNGLRFTQYVDDLTFSGDKTTLKLLQRDIIKIITDEGFDINVRKLKFLKSNESMAITGLITNKRLGVGRSYVRAVERDILRNKKSHAVIGGKISYIHLVQKKLAKRLRLKLKKKSSI